LSFFCADEAVRARDLDRRRAHVRETGPDSKTLFGDQDLSRAVGQRPRVPILVNHFESATNPG
jgi:hypothetical protein